MTTASALQGLNRTNLREQALESLRLAITTGEIAPGSHVVETELSEQLGISRGTLREAMRQLQQEGLLMSGPRGRLTVRTLDAREVADIYAVRGALESLAAEALSARSSGEAGAALLERIDAMDAAERGGLDERVAADLEFHRTLCRLTGNATLLHQWESLEGSIRMSIMWAGRERAVSNMSADRHREIVDAIATGDAATAVRAVREHMDEAAANLVG